MKGDSNMTVAQIMLDAYRRIRDEVPAEDRAECFAFLRDQARNKPEYIRNAVEYLASLF